jgi:hypothetical protein
VPAAAVIPAPIAYIKVVAVKKLVVGSVSRTAGSPPVGVKLACMRDVLSVVVWGYVGPNGCPCDIPKAGVCFRPPFQSRRGALYRVSRRAGTFTLNKLECFKQALFCLHTVCME